MNRVCLQATTFTDHPLALKSKHQVTIDMLDWVKEQEEGIYIGDHWYPWDKIKHFWERP